MRKKYIFGKKLYISILTSIVVLMTTIATTFAWVGVFANSVFDTFNVIIRSSDLDEYGVEISLTGEEGTFGETVNGLELKRNILYNWGYKNVSAYNDSEVEYLFSTLNMHQCTMMPIIEDNKITRLGAFKTMEGTLTNNYFKFDIYVSATKYFNTEISSDYLLDVFLKNNIVIGTTRAVTLQMPYVYPDNFVNPLSALPSSVTPLVAGDSIETCRVNSKSATRVAFEKYEVVDKGAPNLYEGKNPISTIIYTGDSYEYPTYNDNTQTHEFGAILKDEYSLSTSYFNNYEYRLSKNGIKHLAIPSDIYNARGVESSTKDLVLSSNTNHLINSDSTQEKVSLTKMMKISISFWFEGWDADCFNVLNSSPVTLQVILGVKNDEIF